MAKITSDINTRLHACSVERLWEDGLFACGTYELNEEEGVRNGEILVFHDTKQLAAHSCESGVLDMKFATGKLCIALSHGCLSIYDLRHTEETVEFSLDASATFEDEGLYLSLDIDQRLSEDCWLVTTHIAVSTQSGSILVYAYNSRDGKGEIALTHRVSSAHTMMKENMPVWITFFNSHTAQHVTSGGDDCVMKLWGLAEASQDEDDHVSTLISLGNNRSAHTAGVTSGQWHPHHKQIFATGSYDEHVRIWDCRNLSTPLLELHTGGGVWRVKWCCPPGCADSYLVLACMHGGCAIYRLRFTLGDCSASTDEASSGNNASESTSQWRVEAVGEVHHKDERNPQHLAYGIDVLSVTPVMGERGKHELYLASCSFYDNLIQLWSCEL